MASENVKGMLYAKGAPFTSDELERMTDREGWTWMYANHPPKSKRARSRLPELCFTGFTDEEKDSLAAMASSHFKVVTGVTIKLHYLVIGRYPGPMKLQKANDQGVEILTEDQFHELLHTGALPDKKKKKAMLMPIPAWQAAMELHQHLVKVRR